MAEGERGSFTSGGSAADGTAEAVTPASGAPHQQNGAVIAEGIDGSFASAGSAAEGHLPALPEGQAHDSGTFLQRAITQADSERHRQRQRQAAVGRKFYERHECCWDFLVRWLCYGSGAPAQEREAIVQHIALTSAEFVSAAPGPLASLRGLRALKRETQQRIEAFFEAAPVPECWEDEHFVLDLGTKPPAGRGDQVPPPLADVVQATAHFVKFAVAAYSLKLYTLVHPGSSCLNLPLCRLTERSAFQRMSGIAAEDIIDARPRARPFQPAWWLCKDRIGCAVVIAVRGTFGPADLLSDAFARQVHHNDHVLHEGVLECAKRIRDELRPKRPEVQALLNGGFRLVVTGHSLGGAVAAILTWLLREEEHLPAFCFSFGVPLVVDEALAQKMQRFVVGIIHHMDMIPRTGHRSLEDTRDRVAEITATAQQRLARLEGVLERFDLPREPAELERRLERLHTGFQEDDSQPFVRAVSNWEDPAETVAELPARVMSNPGWQLLLQRRGVQLRAVESCPVLCKLVLHWCLLSVRTPDAQDVRVLHPCLTMWTDHFPQAYQYVCEVLAQRMAEKQAPSVLREALDRVTRYFAGGASQASD